LLELIRSDEGQEEVEESKKKDAEGHEMESWAFFHFSHCRGDVKVEEAKEKEEEAAHEIAEGQRKHDAKEIEKGEKELNAAKAEEGQDMCFLI
jgi:hypothetical protein